MIPRMTDGLKLAPGITAIELVATLPQINGRIRTLSLKTYAPSATLEERLAGTNSIALQRVFRKAQVLRIDDKQLPYWESILAATSDSEESTLLIKEAVKHQVTDEAFERLELGLDDLRSGALQRKLKALSKNVVLALCSKCRIDDGTTLHLPMMDFRAEPTTENLSKVKTALSEISPEGGVILESGRSYHYLGFSLMNEDQWLKFLAKCLLLAPLTDTRYIAHRILEGIGSLRISTCKLKPYMPVAVEVL